jgi:hypothetical protein
MKLLKSFSFIELYQSLVVLIFTYLISIIISSSTMGQSSRTPPEEPHLPGAVTEAPAWLRDAPFDVGRFFALPPSRENAAPIYLDALLEFDEALAVCFPPKQRRRASAAKDQNSRTKSLQAIWDEDPDQVDPARLDALLAEYQEGLRKLDLAQKRPQCVFAIGISYDSLLPHAQDARQAARLWILEAHRDIRRGDLDRAIEKVGKVLRLSRDLRPRGPIVCQLVSAAIDWSCEHRLIPAILVHPGLQLKHCDRLLAILKDHESIALDPFATGVEGEYVIHRAVIRVFEARTKTVFDERGNPSEQKLDRLGVARYFAELLQAFQPAADLPDIPKSNRLGDPKYIEGLADYLTKLSPDYKKERAVAADLARSLLVLGKAPHADRVRKIAELEKKHLGEKPGPRSVFLMRLLEPNYSQHSLNCARDAVYLGTAKCLIALRRWQLTHRENPSDLAAVCKAAGLPEVPLDPFSGKPLRMTQDSGGMIIYSVGNDGQDDHGLKDAELGRKETGDFVFRLPRMKAAKR